MTNTAADRHFQIRRSDRNRDAQWLAVDTGASVAQ